MPTARRAPTLPFPADGRRRAVVDAVLPTIDGGRFAAKCIVGVPFPVQAHCFADGHDRIRVMLQWQALGARHAEEVEMTADVNDVWHGSIVVAQPGRCVYTVSAWVDHFDSWRHDLARRDDPGDIALALQTGGLLLGGAAARAKGADRQALRAHAKALAALATQPIEATAQKQAALDEPLAELTRRYPDRSHEVRYPIELPLVADRARAGFSSWYELFPRSASTTPGAHGTFRDVEARLPAIAAMGFDVLYLPPIHPIGRERRKGRNNAVVAAADDVGSPWAIGAVEGGHKEVLPALGTLDDFDRLVRTARAAGLEIALDIAFQCAPDHPWVAAHPEWFLKRPDGSVQYAENPPKKYQDIYPFDFESDDWQALWLELKSVFDHWIGHGVAIFRVDNPHTKAFPFWEWVIAAIKQEHPDVLFLAEAFTRPKVMHRLAKIGFSQSYTYFTWRTDKAELTDYFNELAHGPGAAYFRPNAWPNTPDILHAQFNGGQRSTFVARLVLAATLSANYGLYGPPYEVLDGRPRQPGSEEYLDSEKYQLRYWDDAAPQNIRELIGRVNAIRRDNLALQSNAGLVFAQIENDQLIAYLKRTPDNASVILTIVNLDPVNEQSGWVGLDLAALGIGWEEPFTVHDLLTDQRYTWRGSHNYVALRPQDSPAHILRLEPGLRTERDSATFQ
jgi:starch synthase (maltosyl-transferring)